MDINERRRAVDADVKMRLVKLCFGMLVFLMQGIRAAYFCSAANGKMTKMAHWGRSRELLGKGRGE